MSEVQLLTDLGINTPDLQINLVVLRLCQTKSSKKGFDIILWVTKLIISDWIRSKSMQISI